LSKVSGATWVNAGLSVVGTGCSIPLKNLKLMTEIGRNLVGTGATLTGTVGAQNYKKMVSGKD
jgi:hypothetical protein